MQFAKSKIDENPSGNARVFCLYYIIDMPNFIKMINKTWDSQPLSLFIEEFNELALKHITALYPVLDSPDSAIKAGRGNTFLRRYGSVASDYLELRVSQNMKSTEIKLNFFQKKWKQEVTLGFTKDSRFYDALWRSPILIYELILDELYNYFSSLLVYRGMTKRTIFMSKNRRKVTGWSDNEFVLIDNFSVVPLEPIQFIIPGRISSLNNDFIFEFVLTLLMKPYLFSGHTFETPHFSFTFYNDKREEAYETWNATILKIRKGD